MLSVPVNIYLHDPANVEVTNLGGLISFGSRGNIRVPNKGHRSTVDHLVNHPKSMLGRILEKQGLTTDR